MKKGLNGTRYREENKGESSSVGAFDLPFSEQGRFVGVTDKNERHFVQSGWYRGKYSVPAFEQMLFLFW